MSHTALGRVAVRLLHDTAFVEAVYADPSGALAGVDLSAEERSWLVAVARAAWGTDADRPRRVLAALRDEFPASFGLAPARADRFFCSPHFHAAVQDRGSLALAFGAHMEEDADERVATVARLETATAAVRRAPARVTASAPGHLRLTPAARVLSIRRRGALLLAAVRAAEPPPPLGNGEEPVLVLRRPESGEVTVEPLTDSLARLLGHAPTEVATTELVGIVESFGVDHAEATAIVRGLVADAILL